MADVSPDIAEVFMQKERERGVSGRTANATLILLRSAFKVLANRANIARNPFEGIPTVTENTTHRKPFSHQDLEAIVQAARDDDFIRPVIITGIFTAMRLGDCCRLKWNDVDLQEGFVRVKTSKTGETVEIPIFPPLRAELEQLRTKIKKKPGADDFVFPWAAGMYQTNAQGITYRVRKILEAAGFYDGDRQTPTDKPSDLKQVGKKELLALGNKVLESMTDQDASEQKRRQMAAAFQRYIAGERQPGIASSMGISKSSVSAYLHEMEKRTGCLIIPRAKKPSVLRGDIRQKPSAGSRRLSIRDFHSFRVTWITLALSAGVPLELVQRVTGHKTTQVVLKHYFKPGRDAFKKAIESAMPQLLVGPETAGTIDVDAVVAEPPIRYGDEKSPSEQLVEALAILKGVTGKANQERVARATELIESAKDWYDGHILREPAVARAGH